MYWLCFYNSVDKPEIECAFICASMVIEYAEKFICARAPFYTVFTPQGEVIYLNKFIADYKEEQNK